MGAWAAGSFGNDTALDFLDDLEDFAALSKTLTELETASGELDADDACIA
ncbi:DUF4259 domain-containing protein, partial [Moorena sp. SIO3F7]|nr:DUF4259 domain-containing protein [Moorena sp. SIO3F7]